MIVDPTDPRVTMLLDLLQGEYVGMYGEPDPNPHGDLDRARAPDGGVALLQDPTDAGKAVAMGGWTREQPTVGHLRRMYVHWSKRRRGWGSRVLTEVEAHAAEHGIDMMVLEAGTVQTAALTMYRRAGYVPIDPFGFYADQVTSVFLGRRLVP